MSRKDLLGWDIIWHRHEHQRRGVDFGSPHVRVSFFDSEKGRLGSGHSRLPRANRRRDDPAFCNASHAIYDCLAFGLPQGPKKRAFPASAVKDPLAMTPPALSS